jgi:hypothetical protein
MNKYTKLFNSGTQGVITLALRYRPFWHPKQLLTHENKPHVHCANTFKRIYPVALRSTRFKNASEVRVYHGIPPRQTTIYRKRLHCKRREGTVLMARTTSGFGAFQLAKLMPYEYGSVWIQTNEQSRIKCRRCSTSNTTVIPQLRLKK